VTILGYYMSRISTEKEQVIVKFMSHNTHVTC